MADKNPKKKRKEVEKLDAKGEPPRSTPPPADEPTDALKQFAQALLNRRPAEETDPREAPRKLFNEVQRLLLGFEEAFVHGEHIPGEFLEEVLGELQGITQNMREADIALRRNAGFSDEEWEKAFADRSSYDKKTQNFLGEIDELLSRIDFEEKRIKRELKAASDTEEQDATQSRAKPPQRKPIRKQKGLKKKFKKLGGEGYLKS